MGVAQAFQQSHIKKMTTLSFNSAEKKFIMVMNLLEIKNRWRYVVLNLLEARFSIIIWPVDER